VDYAVLLFELLVRANGTKLYGSLPLDGSLQRPAAQAIWDDVDHCQIIYAGAEMRPATPEECAGLEPAAVWEPEHIADRLQDAFAGRPNHWLEEMIPKHS
jgi:hypothetical protein